MVREIYEGSSRYSGTLINISNFSSRHEMRDNQGEYYDMYLNQQVFQYQVLHDIYEDTS